MTAAAPRRRGGRLVAAIWIALAVVLWNGLYDFRISFGIRDYLLHAALHQLGRGPYMDLAEMMAFTVRESVTFATFWTALVLLGGMLTVQVLRR